MKITFIVENGLTKNTFEHVLPRSASREDVERIAGSIYSLVSQAECGSNKYIVLGFENDKKIHGIRALRAATGFGLKESKDLIEGALTHPNKILDIDRLKYSTNAKDEDILDMFRRDNLQVSYLTTDEITCAQVHDS